ncbi:MAG: transposase [Deltaproteobacteria bacterium]|nr:transposase [Deltaproteobacteria bacterium]
MPRLPRIVIPGLPHHITQRGNRRQKTFFEEVDYKTYLESMSLACKRFDVKIWAYCLMSNHVHLIVVPSSSKSLAKAIGSGHESYTRYINFKKKWRGYLWQGRFGSYVMDDKHLYNAARYVELNPLMARIVKKPEDYPWSSAKAHLQQADDPFVDPKPLLDLYPNWQEYLQEGYEMALYRKMENHLRTGRPFGSAKFLSQLEKQTGLDLLPKSRKK